MKVGTGFNNEENAFVSGTNIAKQALKNGEIEKPTFAIAFCNNNVNAESFFEGIKNVIGDATPVIGGSSVGIITNQVISYESYPAGIVIVEDQDVELQIVSADEIDKDEFKAGQMLANQLSYEENDKILLFYDSVKQPPAGAAPPKMNSSIPLLKGIEKTMNMLIPVIGGGTIGDPDFSPTVQFTGDQVKTQNAVALLLRGNLSTDWTIMHGCTPKDGIYHRITKIEGSVIYELDNQPIVEKINQMYGDEEWQKQLPIKRLTIGINHGERFASEYSESDYVNRLILGVLPDKSGIVIFEEDLEEGTEMQFMLRDSKTMIESAKRNAEKLINDVIDNDKEPIWGFYIDCAGRSAAFSESLTEEAEEVQKIFNKHNIPLFGFYSGVEIAPFIDKNRGLDWTGVLVIFSK